MSTITHPLPVGTRVYYEDFDGGNGVILLNDNTTPEFAQAVQTWDDMHNESRRKNGDAPPISPTPVDQMDYVIQFDDFDEPTPIQAGGVLRVL